LQALLCLIDKKTNEKSTTRPRFIKQDQVAIVRLEVLGGMICLEAFKDFPQMGRFTLRDEGLSFILVLQVHCIVELPPIYRIVYV
jgi:peptide chain release factor subunit 3